jgi:putative hemolysin
MAESLIAAHLDMHTRFPICTSNGDPQSIIGYVNFKDIVSQLRLNPQDPSLKSILRPIPHVPDNLSIATALERMIHGHTHIALVRNTADRVVGFITMEDILEELVGDIHDEFDRLPTHILPSGRAWVVGGGTLLARFKEITGINLPHAPPVRTLNDWVNAELGKRPSGGERIEKDDVHVLVRKIRRQKVLEAQVSGRS